MAVQEPQSGPSPHHTRRVILATGAALVAVAAVLVFASHLRSSASGNGARLDVIAPDFTLRDQLGRPTSLAQFRGKVVVLTFVDPECTEICPLTTQSMVDAVRLLPPARAARVQLLGIDANPAKTRVADVAAYTRAHRLSGQWRFLTGPERTLEDVWHRYNVYVDAVKGNIEHDPIVFLIDGSGHERQVLFTAMRYASVGCHGSRRRDGLRSTARDGAAGLVRRAHAVHRTRTRAPASGGLLRRMARGPHRSRAPACRTRRIRAGGTASALAVPRRD